MATTEYTVNHAMARQEWSRKLMKEALEETYAFRFMGTNKNAPIYVKNELKSSGYQVTYGLRMQLAGAGRQDDNTLEGFEEALSIYTDSLQISQLRHAVRTHGRASEQRVPFSTREEAKDGLKDWWARRIDQSWFNQICGVTGLDEKYTGLNSVTATDANHAIFSGETAEASLSDTSGNQFTLSLIDSAVEKAKTITPLMRPVMVNGQQKFICFLHPYQVKDLRTEVSSSQITWFEAQKILVQGGQGMNHPIYTGAIGEYNGVVFHESNNIPAISGTEAYRAAFVGAQSACIAFGKEGGQNRMNWVESLFDYDNQLGVAAGMVWGLKKSMFNSANYGAITISTGAGA